MDWLCGQLCLVQGPYKRSSWRRLVFERPDMRNRLARAVREEFEELMARSFPSFERITENHVVSTGNVLYRARIGENLFGFIGFNSTVGEMRSQLMWRSQGIKTVGPRAPISPWPRSFPSYASISFGGRKEIFGSTHLKNPAIPEKAFRNKRNPLPTQRLLTLENSSVTRFDSLVNTQFLISRDTRRRRTKGRDDSRANDARGSCSRLHGKQERNLQMLSSLNRTPIC